jgi:MHS family proline/betaine transporter-like MFS transporter
MVVIPPLGHLSDKIGRRPLLLTSCAAFILLPYPLLNIMLEGASLGAIVTIQLVLALAIALYSGPGAAAIAEIFPTRDRTTLLSIANGTAVAIFGGFAPYIAERLIQATGSPLAPAYYVIASAMVSAAVIVSLHETAHDHLK